MFESLPLAPELLGDADDSAVTAAVVEWARAAAATEARRLAAIAEVTVRCCREGERAYRSCDGWDLAAAEVAAALGLSHGRASGQMRLAMALRTRLPEVNALFLAGNVPLQMVSMIAWRTYLVDDDAIARVDAAIAEHAMQWGRLSETKLVDAIDAWVLEHDPAAIRRSLSRARSRCVEIGEDQDEEAGTSSLWGRLFAHDAAMLDRRLLDMARGVCENDPRTIGQRRADALGALAAGADHLTCQCGESGCPTAGSDPRSSNVVINVVGDAAALAAAVDRPGPAAAQPDSTRPAHVRPGVVLSGGIVPTPLLAELIRTGAKVRWVQPPATKPEARYRPSAALERFVRARDLTCRFPGCSHPAEHCDIDHTIAWPLGPTHPSNLKCLCRKHHLLRTFWAGPGGWTDVQHADGSVVWTSPSGRTNTTYPGSSLFFPGWSTATSPVRPRSGAVQGRGGNLMMPRRKRTRSQSRMRRIRQERALNAPLVAKRNRPPPM